MEAKKKKEKGIFSDNTGQFCETHSKKKSSFLSHFIHICVMLLLEDSTLKTEKIYYKKSC